MRGERESIAERERESVCVQNLQQYSPIFAFEDHPLYCVIYISRSLVRQQLKELEANLFRKHAGSPLDL
jgi:hypothetical protein